MARVHRKSFDPTEDRFLKVAIGLWAVGAILGLAFWAGVIYVAVHFIAKYW